MWWRLSLICIMLYGCAVTPDIKYRYQLDNFGYVVKHGHTRSIFVNTPQAVPEYQTSAMVYVNKRFESNTYVHNAWVSPPGDMLFTLLMQSLEHSRHFRVVAGGPYADTDYRLDTEIMAMYQDFTKKPCRFHMIINAVLTDVHRHRVVASHTFDKTAVCASPTPYGGVIAANALAKAWTRDMSLFCSRD